jgi:predicted nucleic acid-binding protein
MNIFLDTNIYLSFYHFASDDLEELKKLAVVIGKKKATLLFPDQVWNEFRRNREGKIADAMKRITDQKLGFTFPQVSRNYPEYKEIRKHQQEYERYHALLIDQIRRDAAARTLKADLLFNELFEISEDLPLTTEIITSASLRMNLGNPPGKNGTLGDAVNWETLLARVPKKEPLYFVSEDKHYCSPLFPGAMNSYLLKEWEEKKESEIYFFKKLSQFFKSQFPDIKLASELEKDILIRELGESPSFARTHTIISQLKNYTDYSLSQIENLVRIALSNFQVTWILTDEDVMSYFQSIIKGNETRIEAKQLADLQELLGETQREASPCELDDLPF